MKYTEEQLFCAKYLFECGFTGDDIEAMREQAYTLNTQFVLTKVQTDFYRELAEKLRNIWPPGEKDGKWPWRDSVDNLAKRLEFMWTTCLQGETYSEEEVLMVARKYVACFEDNKKYMRTLKYFILKQDKLVESNGKIRVNNVSMLGNMLKDFANSGESKLDSTIETDINISDWEGELV